MAKVEGHRGPFRGLKFKAIAVLDINSRDDQNVCDFRRDTQRKQCRCAICRRIRNIKLSSAYPIPNVGYPPGAMCLCRSVALDLVRRNEAVKF